MMIEQFIVLSKYSLQQIMFITHEQYGTYQTHHSIKQKQKVNGNKTGTICVIIQSLLLQ